MAGTDDQGFEVAPVRIGGGPAGGTGRPGRGRLPIVAIVVIAVAVSAFALAGSRVDWRSEPDLAALDATPSPGPSRTPRARPTPLPTATPLPELTIDDGPRPREPVPIQVSSFRLLDPATGDLGGLTNLRLDRDAVFRGPSEDGWSCVCFERTPGEFGETTIVTVRSLDDGLTETMRNEIGVYRSEARPPSQDVGLRFDLERSSDGHFGYLVVAERSIDHWRIRLELLDLWMGSLVESIELGSLDAPVVEIAEGDPSPVPGMFRDAYLNGPEIRLSPSGRRLVVYGTVETHDPIRSTSESVRFGWFADVAADDFGTTVENVRRAGAAWGEPTSSSYCSWVVWLSDDELATTCWDWRLMDQRPNVSVRTLDPDGRTLVDVPIEVSSDWGMADPIVDTANRTIWIWEPAGHVLHRIDLDDETNERIDSDPAAPAPVREPPAATRATPAWSTTLSDLVPWSSPGFAFDPDGTRLYAAGVTMQDPDAPGYGYAPGSSGIWVFDASSFALVDHWPATAAYSSIGLVEDGRWLVAVGQPGIDDAGRPSSWSSSITIHDTVDGRVALQVADLGDVPVLPFR